MRNRLLFSLTAVLLAPSLIWAQSPVFINSNPARNAVSAPRETNVSLTFSQAMSQPAIGSKEVVIHGSQSGTRTVAGKGSFSGGGTNTLVFDPSQDFKPGEKVSVTVKAKNASQNVQSTPQVFSFTARTEPASAQFITGNVFGSNRSYAPFNALTADFTGDGHVDVISQVYSQDRYYAGIYLFETGAWGPLLGSVRPIGVYFAFIRTAVDWDGDGDVDLIGDDGGHLVFAKNDGNGNFTQTFRLNTPFYASLVKTADLDGDGDLDVYYAGYELNSDRPDPNAAKSLINDGAGNFSEGFTVWGIRTTGAELADLDNDGDVDLVAPEYETSSQSSQLFVYLNDGKANFVRKGALYPTTGAPGHLTSADLDGDGDIDLAIMYAKSLLVLHNDGQAGFTLGSQNAVSGYTLQTYLNQGIEAADYDGDGDMDVMTLSQRSTQDNTRSYRFLLFRNEPNHSFTLLPQANALDARAPVSSADFNGDGKLDLFTITDEQTNLGNPKLSILFNALPVLSYDTLSLSTCVDKPARLYLPFLVNTAAVEGNVFTAQLSDASGSFTNPQTVGTLASRFSGTIVVTIPANMAAGTGYRLRVVASKLSIPENAGVSLTIYQNCPTVQALSPMPDAQNIPRETNLSLTFSQAISQPAIGGKGVVIHGSQTGTRTVAGKGSFSGGGTNTLVFNPSADFKPGEKVSVSVTTQARNMAGIPLEKGQVYDFKVQSAPASALFNAKTISAVENDVTASGDWDGNGDLDLLVWIHQKTNGYEWTGYFSVQSNDGAGHFTETSTFFQSNSSNLYIPEGVASRDMDGDGDLDVVFRVVQAGNDREFGMEYYLNDGKGVFSPSPQRIPWTSGTFYIYEPADMDGDGDPDIVSTSIINRGQQLNYRLVLARNNGMGVFDRGDTILLPMQSYWPQPIKLIDIDNDNDLDVQLYDLVSTRQFLLNDGSGHFDSIVSFPPFTDYVDLNGDGARDIMLVSSKSVLIRLNDGQGHFITNQTIGISDIRLEKYQKWKIADLDGDGDQDLLIYDLQGNVNVLRIFLNNGQGFFSEGEKVIVGDDRGYHYENFVMADLDGDGDLDLGARNQIFFNQNLSTDGCTASGTILREYWAKVNGNQTADVPVNKAPTSTSYLTSFEGPTKVGENYASRIRGYLCAPETGNYTFWIASDDYGDLYLSSDDNAANKQLIAWIKGWSNPRQYNKHYSQKSALIYLEKGKRYYIEALHKQAWVNDNLSVAWRLPSSAASASPVVIPGSVLSPFVPGNAREGFEGANAEESVGLNLQAAPNPFNSQTTITFTAGESGQAMLDLYDLKGQRVQSILNAQVQAGEQHQAVVKGSQLTQGLYLLRLVNGSQVSHLKVAITR